jgi:hypothetical protein
MSIESISWSPEPTPDGADAIGDFPLVAGRVEMRRLSNCELVLSVDVDGVKRVYRIKGLARVNFERANNVMPQ